MIPDASIRPALRAALAAGLLAATFATASCTAPLGPGLRIERQRIAAAYEPAPQPHIRVRAAWRVKNIGNQPLSTVEVRLPKSAAHVVTGLRIESGGREIAPSATAATDTVSVALSSPLALKGKLEVAVSYELAGIPSAASGVAVSADGFVLPPGDWAPALRPPKGTFASGGAPPERWEMTVNVPAGFRVMASGRARGQEKDKGGATFRFEQRREYESPFAAGGAYQEAKIGAAGNAVLIWTRQALAPETARRAGEAAAGVAQFYDAEFGAREASAQTLWIIECPAAAACQPVPGAALPGAEMYSQQFVQAGLPEIAQQLATTWLDFRVSTEESEPLPMGALADYAADLAAPLAEGGDAHEQAMRRLVLRLGLLAGDDKGMGILNVRSSDPEAVRRFARDKSELFFFALGDAAGRDNLHHALLHLLHAYHGRTWRAADLRAAVEQESGKDLAGLFRTWLTEPGVPKEFQNIR